MNDQMKSSQLPELTHQIPVNIPRFLCCVKETEFGIF